MAAYQSSASPAFVNFASQQSPLKITSSMEPCKLPITLKTEDLQRAKQVLQRENERLRLSLENTRLRLQLLALTENASTKPASVHNLSAEAKAMEDDLSTAASTSEHSQDGEDASECGDCVILQDNVDLAQQGVRTSVMLRNVPNNYSRDMLLDLFDQYGFAAAVDFLYLPLDRKSTANLGYAFVNVHAEWVESFWASFQGFCAWATPQTARNARRTLKVATLEWNATQGLDAMVAMYRNHSIMHPIVPEIRKPVLLRDGVKVAFPSPTRALRPPPLRKHLASVSVSND